MDCQNLWEKSCTFIRSELNEITYSTFIERGLSAFDFRGDQFILRAESDFYYDYITNRYLKTLSEAVTRAAGRDLRLLLLTPKQAEDYSQNTDKSPIPQPMLNPKYTFDSFVVGSGSRFAHAASLAVAESPSDAYNPLFIYGGVGLGKTHLMHAIGHYILEKNPSLRLEYVTSETFTIELVNAIQTNRNIQFREKYRNVDVLLIDDIQFISGRDSTQDEFFHTFNTLHSAGKQIIISSDRPPKDISKLTERLRSRFLSGLIADIQAPDLETRCAILRQKAIEDEIDVSNEVLMMIAQSINSNVRELEGSLTRLTAYASLSNRKISVELAKDALRETLAQHERRSITCGDVINAVSNYYSVSVEELVGSRRNRSIAVPRQVAMYLCRLLTPASLPKIGEALGGRDHTTILYGCSKIEELEINTPQVKTAIDDLSKMLKP